MNPLSFDGPPSLRRSQQATIPMIQNPGAILSTPTTSTLVGRQRQHSNMNSTDSEDVSRRVMILQALALDKRRREEQIGNMASVDDKDERCGPPPLKKRRQEEPRKVADPAPVKASDEGIATFQDNDVLSGRGGGTNIHPGNRYFRDLINRSRCVYLKARKNDKPAISREIVKKVRQRGGRFLKKREGSKLWLEIGDDAAREKASQALRQRAPEMRKVLFESEVRKAREQAEQLRQSQHRYLSSSFSLGISQPRLPPGPTNILSPYAPSHVSNKIPFSSISSNVPNSEAYAQLRQELITATLLGGGINRISPRGA